MHIIPFGTLYIHNIEPNLDKIRYMGLINLKDSGYSNFWYYPLRNLDKGLYS